MHEIDLDRRIKFIRSLTQTVDIHVHPLDVIGVCEHLGDENTTEELVSTPASLGISQKFNFNRLINSLTKLSFSIAPSIVKSSILEYYQSMNIGKILYEMNYAGIDRSFFVPIEPYVTNNETLKVSELTSRASSYASFDIHNPDATKNINLLFLNHSFVGIKLHPNLQGFMPQIEKNNDEIVRNNLINIYDFAEKRGIPLLFHTGKSYILKNPRSNLSKSVLIHRSSNNGVLENFFQHGEYIFRKFSFPVIFAHLGSYALTKLDIKNILKVALNNNVFFDTAGINPKWITKLLNIEPKVKILFGSDAYYYSQHHSVISVFDAIQSSELPKRYKIEVIRNTFGNYAKLIF
ncbi:MAG: hypothetical protein AAB424_03765 [Patescibacteria group bacterium]